MILLFVFLLSLVNAWTVPEKFMTWNYDIWFHGSFYDSKGEFTHIVFAKNDYSHDIFHLRLRNGKISLITQISKNFTHFIGITGIDGGGCLYIAFIENEHNVVFLETVDSGISWLTPQIFPHSDKTINHGSLNLINETGRLYMTYLFGNDIYFVSRPQGSTLFGNERIIIKSNIGIYTISSCYTIRRELPIIHITWIGNNFKVHYSQSTNNGNSWTDAEVLFGVQTSVLRMISNTRVSNTIFIFYDGKQRYSLVYSKDHGDTYSKEIKFDWGNANVGLMICGNKRTKVLISSYNIYKQLTGWESNKIDIVEYKTPFYLLYNTLIGCNEIEPNQVQLVGRLNEASNIYATIKKNLEDSIS